MNEEVSTEDMDRMKKDLQFLIGCGRRPTTNHDIELEKR
jgi:hypothetical protein